MLIHLTKEITEKLSKTEFEIIQFINEHEEKLSELSIVEIGFATYSSPSTVSRAIRKCGMNGFNELRHRFTMRNKKEEIHDMGEVINKSLIETQRVIEQISVSSVLEVVRLINGASRILVFGRGLSEYVAEEFTLKLQLLDYNAMFTKDPNIMRIKTKRMKQSELIINFSLNGYTQELVDAAENASYVGAKCVTCCCNEDSPLIPLSSVSIIGCHDKNATIKEYEVDSRLSLQVIARIIIEYMVMYQRR